MATDSQANASQCWVTGQGSTGDSYYDRGVMIEACLGVHSDLCNTSSIEMKSVDQET